MKEKQPLYDYSIKYNTSNLPIELQEYIAKLEEYDKTGDWLNYDYIFEILEMVSKSYFAKGMITETDYKILLRKYGWLCD